MIFRQWFKDVLMTVAVLLRSVVMGNYHATFWRAVEGATLSLTLIPLGDEREKFPLHLG